MDWNLVIVILQVLILWNVWRWRRHFQRLRRMVFLMRQIINGESGSYWNHQLKELADIERELS